MATGKYPCTPVSVSTDDSPMELPASREPEYFTD